MPTPRCSICSMPASGPKPLSCWSARGRALADALQRGSGLAQPADRKFYAEALQINARLSKLQKESSTCAARPARAAGAGRIAAAEGEIQRLERLPATSRRASSPRAAPGAGRLTAGPLAVQQVMKRENPEVLTYIALKERSPLAPERRGGQRALDLPHARGAGGQGLEPAPEPGRPGGEVRRADGPRAVPLPHPAGARLDQERAPGDYPHDDLNYVPFQAFQDPADGRFLEERFDISYAPSATVLMGLKPSAGIRGRLLAAADPEIGAARRRCLRSAGSTRPGANCCPVSWSRRPTSRPGRAITT